METGLKKEIYESMALVWSGTAGRESSDEYVVPDTMPDAGAIVDAEGVLTVRSKDTEAGHILLGAAVSVSVIYAPEDGGSLRSLEFNLPADVRLDAPGVDAGCSTVARMRLRSVDARVVNSRKIAVRADVEAEAGCYRTTALELACGLDENEGGAHVLEGAAEAVMVSDVREKTFAVTDEYPYPSGCTGTEAILSRRVEPVVEDVKCVGGKAVFRGRIRAEILFSDPDTGRVTAGRYETEWSQIMEIGAQSDDAMPEVALFVTGAYFDPPEFGREQPRIAAEIHLGAQCVCRERRQMRFLRDIYSNRTELVPVMENVPVIRDVRIVTVRQTVAGRVEAWSGEGELLRATASVGGTAVEGGTVRTTVNIRLLCRASDGSFSAARSRLTAEFTPSELPDGAELRDVAVTVTDVYCVGASGDIRAILQMDALAAEPGFISCVSAVEEDPDAWNARERAPSITLIRAAAGTDMWSVARKYHSTVEAIAAANEGRTEGLLLIPKAR